MRSPMWIVLTFTLLGVVIAGKIIHKDLPNFEDLTPFEQIMVEASLIQSMMKSPDWNKMTSLFIGFMTCFEDGYLNGTALVVKTKMRYLHVILK